MKMYGEEMAQDKGYAKKHNQGGMKQKGEMGYAGKVEHMDSVKGADMKKVKPMKYGDKGYDAKAHQYNY